MNLWTGAVPLPYLLGDLNVFKYQARGLQAMGVFGWGNTPTVERLIRYQLSYSDVYITVRSNYSWFCLKLVFEKSTLINELLIKFIYLFHYKLLSQPILFIISTIYLCVIMKTASVKFACILLCNTGISRVILLHVLLLFLNNNGHNFILPVWLIHI